MNFDRHLRHRNRIELVKGDVCETIPKFVESRGEGLRIALLNLDLDLYEPTRIALEYFVPRMARGGVIFDEYAVDTLAGRQKQSMKYFTRTFGKRPRVIKFPWHSNPTGYVEID